MNLHSTNNIVRKKSKTGICHVMQGKESKTCPSDSPYKNVMNDKTFYPKTTPMYKAFIKKAYNMYKSKEKDEKGFCFFNDNVILYDVVYGKFF
jgi:hypothetical protein